MTDVKDDLMSPVVVIELPVLACFVFCNREEPMTTAKMSAMASPFKIPEAPLASAELENDVPQHEKTPGFHLLQCPQNTSCSRSLQNIVILFY